MAAFQDGIAADIFTLDQTCRAYRWWKSAWRCHPYGRWDADGWRHLTRSGSRWRHSRNGLDGARRGRDTGTDHWRWMHQRRRLDLGTWKHHAWRRSADTSGNSSQSLNTKQHPFVAKSVITPLELVLEQGWAVHVQPLDRFLDPPEQQSCQKWKSSTWRTAASLALSNLDSSCGGGPSIVNDTTSSPRINTNPNTRRSSLCSPHIILDKMADSTSSFPFFGGSFRYSSESPKTTFMCRSNAMNLSHKLFTGG